MIFDNIFAVALWKAKEKNDIKKYLKNIKKDVDIKETLWYHLKRCLRKKATKIIEKNFQKTIDRNKSK